MKKEKEIWVDSYYFPDTYEVSNFGKVRNKITNHILTPWMNNYPSLGLCNNGKKFNITMHRLVYFSFNPKKPISLHIHHLDNDITNFKLSNLHGMDGKLHAKMHAKIKLQKNIMPIAVKGEKNPNRKGKTIAIDLKTNKIKFIMMGEHDVNSHGFSNPTVNHIINKKQGRVTHKGCTFRRISDDIKIKIGQIFSEKLLTSK